MDCGRMPDVRSYFPVNGSRVLGTRDAHLCEGKSDFTNAPSLNCPVINPFDNFYLSPLSVIDNKYARIQCIFCFDFFLGVDKHVAICRFAMAVQIAVFQPMQPTT